MLVIKTQICRTSPPRSANLCPDISLTYFHLPPQRVVPCHGEELHAAAAHHHLCFCRMLPLPAAATAAAATAHNRRTPYSAAAIADAFSDNNGETMVPSRGCLFNFTHASCPLIFHCLQFFRRSCQEGQIFRGRSLTVSLIPSRKFSLYQQLSDRVWLRCIWRGTPTRGALWISSRGSSRSST